jgi:uncharacterized protein YpmS
MKKTMIVILILATLMAMAACGKKASPEGVADSFLTALEKKDFEAAKTMATPESDGMISIIESFMANMKEEDMGVYQHKITNTVVEGDSAQVSYEIWTSLKPDEREKQELKIVKVDGQWKASLEKGNMAK